MMLYHPKQFIIYWRNNESTIKDVARTAHCSTATVSRVLNGKNVVDEELKKLVLNAVKELNYVPNFFAKNLSSKTTSIIAVVVPNISTNFFGLLLEGIELKASEEGYFILFCDTQDDISKELKYLNLCGKLNVAGVIVASNFYSVEELLRLNIPCISVDHYLSEKIPSISSFNYQGGVLAGELLLKHNPKLILLFRGPSFLLTTIERTQGFIDTIKDQAVIKIFDFDLITPNNEEIDQIIKDNLDCDAIFCLSDSIAVLTEKILFSNNLNVPNDVELIGYDNSFLTNCTLIPLTSIEQPVKEMGKRTFELLLKLIKREELEEIHSHIDIRIDIKESTKK